MEIYDINGRSVGAYPCGRPNTDEIIINISHLPAGVYLVKVATEQGKITKKLLNNKNQSSCTQN